MTPAVRPVRASEIDAWCACPMRPDDAGFDAWVKGEHAWVRRWHGERPTLFAFETGGAFLGKYDLPMEEQGRWRLWAPSARDADVMRALCDHVLAGSRKAGIGAVEVVLESAHRNRELAREALLRAGFLEAEERVVVGRDLTRPLPPRDVAGLAFRSGTATDDLLRRCGAGGPVPDSARRCSWTRCVRATRPAAPSTSGRRRRETPRCCASSSGRVATGSATAGSFAPRDSLRGPTHG